MKHHFRLSVGGNLIILPRRLQTMLDRLLTQIFSILLCSLQCGNQREENMDYTKKGERVTKERGIKRKNYGYHAGQWNMGNKRKRIGLYLVWKMRPSHSWELSQLCFHCKCWYCIFPRFSWPKPRTWPSFFKWRRKSCKLIGTVFL